VREDFEGYYLGTVADPKTALTLMIAVQVLSSHSEDEEYILQDEHGWIKVYLLPRKMMLFLYCACMARYGLSFRSEDEEYIMQEEHGWIRVAYLPP
jgi:hypothetical protein